MSLRNMNIAPRAFLGFALIGALMLFLGVFALNQMSKIRAATEDITLSSVPSIRALDEFTQLTLRLRVLSYRLLTNREPDVQQKTLEAFDVRNQQIRTAQAVYEKLIDSSEERAAYDEYVRLLGQYHQIEERMKSLSRANQMDELRTLLNTELLSNSEQVNAVLNRLLDINNKMATATNQQAADQYDMAFELVVILLILATALTMLFAWLLTRSITLPIAQALDAAEEIAEGNLTRPIKVEGNDEAGRLLLAMAKMQDKLKDTLQRIAGSATQLASAAEELNAVTDESARGLTQQNNEIEQAATAVKDVPLVLFCVGGFFAFLTLYVPFFYITVFATSHDFSSAEFAPYLVTLLNAGSVFGRIVPNAMADRWGSLNVIVVCTFVSSVLAFAWLGIRNPKHQEVHAHPRPQKPHVRRKPHQHTRA